MKTGIYNYMHFLSHQPFLVSPSPLSESIKDDIETFIAFGREIDNHFQDTPQWEEKIFPHMYPHLYQCLPYEKLRFVDTDFLHQFEAHLAHISHIVNIHL